MKNKSGIIKVIFFTLLLILILGNSLKIAYEPMSFDHQNICVYSNNQKNIHDFQNFIMSNKVYKNKIKIVQVKSKEIGINNVEKGINDGYIELDNSRTMYPAQVKNLYIYYSNDFDVSMIKNAIESYKYSGVLKGSKNMNMIQENPVNLENKRQSSTGYYSVTMLLMIMLYCSRYGVDIVNEDNNRNMIGRIKSLPMNPAKRIIGKIIGSVSVIFSQAMCIIIFTKFVYKVNWGDNMMNIIFIILLFSFFSVCLGTFIGSVVKELVVTDYIINMAVPFFTLISGGYVGNMFLSDTINNISFLSPSYAAENIIFKNIYGYGMDVSGFYIELIIISILLFSITLVFGRRNIY
jgi:ABC-2 type transport system permease protein